MGAHRRQTNISDDQMEDHAAIQIVFVVGFPRSGTTFLATQLGNFQGFSSTPETRYIREIIEERVFLSRKTSLENLKLELSKNQRITDMNVDVSKALAPLKSHQVDRLDGFKMLLQEFAQKHSCHVVIEKSPVHCYHVLKLLKWFPDAKIIGIQRDGRDALNSLRKTPWATGSDRKLAADWVYRNRLLSRAKKAAPDRVRLIAFEDLVLSGEDAIAGLAQWASNASQGPIFETSNQHLTIPDWERGWKKQAGQQAITSRANAWKLAPKQDTFKQFEMIAGTELRELGYDSPKATALGKVFQCAFHIDLTLRSVARRIISGLGMAERFSSQAGLQRRLRAHPTKSANQDEEA